MGLVVDAIEHAIGATSGAVDTYEFVAKRSSDPLRVFDQRSGDEINDGGTHCLGQFLGDRSRCWASDDEFVAFLGH